MTIDEAIKHAEEVAESKEKQVKNGDWKKDSLTERNCIKCASEHRQLAEWLKDYKRLKEQPEITWVTGTDGAKVAFWDVPIPKVLKICEILQEPTVTSTKDNAEMTYPQVDGITPTVVEPIGDDYKYIKSISNPTGIEFDIDIPKKIESYGKLLKHPVVKHIMGMDETQEQLDFAQPHKKIPVTLTVSDDLISRETVCDYIAEFINHEYSTQSECEMVDSMIDGIQHMPSVNPQEPKWIPCSERLPDNNNDVLVYDYSDIFVAWYSGIDGNWCSADNRFDEYTPIIAWQPLPEPYEPQERSDKE